MYHRTNGLFHCTDCNYVNADPACLRKHLNRHLHAAPASIAAHELKHRCVEDGVDDGSASLSVVQPEPGFCCLQCGAYYAKSKGELRKHLRAVHGKQEDYIEHVSFQRGMVVLLAKNPNRYGPAVPETVAKAVQLIDSASHTLHSVRRMFDSPQSKHIAARSLDQRFTQYEHSVALRLRARFPELELKDGRFRAPMDSEVDAVMCTQFGDDMKRWAARMLVVTRRLVHEAVHTDTLAYRRHLVKSSGSEKRSLGKISEGTS